MEALGFGGADIDSDSIIDSIDPDDDNDGLEDAIDRVLCSSDQGLGALSSLNASIQETKDRSSSDFQKSFAMSAKGVRVLNISLKKSTSLIQCNSPNISIGSKDSRNFMMVSGVGVTDATKTVFLARTERMQNASSQNSSQAKTPRICIKDEEISSISEVSQKCKGDNEIILNCDSKEKKGYLCALDQDRYVIEGLHHSAVMEFGDCEESWKCSSWSNCKDASQARVCTDSNQCQTQYEKPKTSQECEMLKVTSSPSSSQTSSSSPGSQSQFTCAKEWECSEYGDCEG
ncbi:MAG TPA: hypothetical protein VJB12_02555, partial [Candidatus Nanoarchaeia archaeon]|nr:hypothetical protein [Candidatus Nanoarchaeia archaeon]